MKHNSSPSLPQLHAYLDQALPAPLSYRVEMAIKTSPPLQDQIRSLRDLNQHVELQFSHLAPPSSPSPSEALARFQQRLKREAVPPLKMPHRETTPRSTPWWIQLPQWSLLTAMFAFCIWLPLRSPQAPPPTPMPAVSLPSKTAAIPVYTHKGNVRFSMLHAHRTARANPTFAPAVYTHPNDILYPGDLVQFSYQLNAPKHVMLVSLNQHGELFSFIPFRGQHSLYLPAGEGTLPRSRSLILDEYTGPERFFFVASDKPFSYEQLKRFIMSTWQKQRQSFGSSAPQRRLQASSISKQPNNPFTGTVEFQNSTALQTWPREQTSPWSIQTLLIRKHLRRGKQQ